MPYSKTQYDPAIPFLRGGDDNVVSDMDKKRIQAYDLYEAIYSNSSNTLKLSIRGVDQVPLLMPSGRKIIETTGRFLAKNFDYLVETVGDEGTRQLVETWFQEFFKREAVRGKLTSNKRWGLIRGDAMFYVYANPEKAINDRICIVEIDPRQVFTIEDNESKIIGYHVVDTVQDHRKPDDAAAKLARKRTFLKEKTDAGVSTGKITTEVTHWEVGKWDERVAKKKEDLVRVSSPNDEDLTTLPEPISQLPIYSWQNKPPQNSTWGISQLEGLETLLYGLNQSLTDEDATIVFQGLGMYVTNAAPPTDPNTGELTDWNIGPMQIIEVPGGSEQYFNRVTGVSDVSPYQDHMNFINEKGIEEGTGLPSVAVGKVDVAIAESGISLALQLMPLIAANEEKEEAMLVVLDQMLHDITTMWLPAFESETFSNFAILQDISVVSIFDDPMPKNRDAEIQETVLLGTSHFILKSMIVAKLRELGWKFPQVDAQGNPLTDDDIAAMLTAEAEADASLGLSALDTGGQVDENGNPIDPNNPDQNAPDQTTIPLGVS